MTTLARLAEAKPLAQEFAKWVNWVLVVNPKAQDLPDVVGPFIKANEAATAGGVCFLLEADGNADKIFQGAVHVLRQAGFTKLLPSGSQGCKNARLSLLFKGQWSQSEGQLGSMWLLNGSLVLFESGRELGGAVPLEGKGGSQNPELARERAFRDLSENMAKALQKALTH